MKQATITLSAIALLFLTSCMGNPISFIPWMSSQLTVSQLELEKIKNKLNKVKAAVNAGNFVAARREFSQVETVWKTVKLPVRTESSNDYTAVAIYIDEVKQTLYHKPLSREKAILSLLSLEKSIEDVTAS